MTLTRDTYTSLHIFLISFPSLLKILCCLINHVLARPDRETCWSPRLVYRLPLVFFKGFRTSQFISRIFLGQFLVVVLPRTQCNISLCWSICWMFLCWDSMLHFWYSSEMLWYVEIKYYGIPFCPKIEKQYEINSFCPIYTSLDGKINMGNRSKSVMKFNRLQLVVII